MTSPSGKLIRAGGVWGRYVRMWCNGSAIYPGQSKIVEIEVYGRESPQVPPVIAQPQSAPAEKQNLFIREIVLGGALAVMLILRAVRSRLRTSSLDKHSDA